jgi:hypothetical protein
MYTETTSLPKVWWCIATEDAEAGELQVLGLPGQHDETVLLWQIAYDFKSSHFMYTKLKQETNLKEC